MNNFVVTFLYDGHAPTPYTVEQVNTLRRMVEKNLTIAHRFVVFTDYIRSGLDSEILQLKMIFPWKEMERCLPRTQMFNSKTLKNLASRVVQIDLDCVITGNIDFVFKKHSKKKIALWRDALAHNRSTDYLYNGSLVSFDPRSNLNLADPPKMSTIGRSGFAGSDQAWYRIELGENMPTFDQCDGVYSFKFDGIRKTGLLPEDARIVFFHGQPKPWDIKLDWIESHYK